LIKTLAQETSEVITAYLHSLSSPHAPPSDILTLFSPETIENRAINLIRSTAGNKSSMAYDVSQGRTTEISHINGYLIALAKRLGITTPNHQLLADMVKFTSEINAPNGPLHSRILDQTSVNNYGSGLKSLSPKRFQVEEQRLKLRERTVWARENEYLENKRARRYAKRNTTRVERDEENNGSGSGGLPQPVLSFLPAAPQKPKYNLDQMIASAPRQERTWDVHPSPPTARGPLPKKRVITSTPEMITQAIHSAPSQISKAIDTVQSQVEPVVSEVVNVMNSPLDQLIASCPRAERTWDVNGGTVTTLGLAGSGSIPFPKSFTSVATSSLKGCLNDMIAGAPRMERTWSADRGVVPIQGSKGRFTTSRTSGS